MLRSPIATNLTYKYMHSVLKLLTYVISNLRGKCMAESPVVWLSSSVDSVSSPKPPPMMRVPAGEAQLQWDSLDPWRVCECFQLPPLK